MTTKMKVFSAFTSGAVLSATCFLGVSKTEAATIVLDFEGLQNLESVNNFYNGGFGGNGSGPGTNYGITFSPNALALIDQDAGGSGNFGGEPSPNTALFFLSGESTVMNVSAGFDTSFSFFYTTPFYQGSVNLYDGLNGTGSLLAGITLPTTPDNGNPDPTGRYSPFMEIGVRFTGTARSIDFGGAANYIAFDKITLSSAAPIKPPSPVPGSLPGLNDRSIPTPALLPGLIGMGVAAIRKRKAKAVEEASEV